MTEPVKLTKGERGLLSLLLHDHGVAARTMSPMIFARLRDAKFAEIVVVAGNRYGRITEAGRQALQGASDQ